MARLVLKCKAPCHILKKKKKRKKELVKIPERQKQMKVKCQLVEFKQRLHFVLCRLENKQF